MLVGVPQTMQKVKLLQDLTSLPRPLLRGSVVSLPKIVSDSSIDFQFLIKQ
jgi:hypothetical protein